MLHSGACGKCDTSMEERRTLTQWTQLLPDERDGSSPPSSTSCVLESVALEASRYDAVPTFLLHALYATFRDGLITVSKSLLVDFAMDEHLCTPG